MPTVGQIVHYHPDPPEDGRPLAALVTGTTEVEDLVYLRVHDADGASEYAALASYSEAEEPGCWSWPPSEG